MEFWQIWCVVAFVFIIVEVSTPAMFFLNLAFASFVVSFFAYFNLDLTLQVILFAIMSLVGIFILRPYMLKKESTKQKTGIEEKYINKKAKVIEEINENQGAITIYGERWLARERNNAVVPINNEVKIVDNDGTLFIVEKLD
ncbi:MAG: NfeD family protein [Candidatus Gastranaerophilales bacterium]|nr:NfeD family protein [Candidatus Gastranaerophilales bacterium]